MPNAPKDTLDEISTFTKAWSDLAPTASFAGLTLDQYKAKVKPSLDARGEIDQLNNKLTSAQDKRDAADVLSSSINQKVVKSVVGDVNYGDDSDLYDAFGYIRKSDKKSGLKRTLKAKTIKL